ncbi:hypothetical protein HOD75_00960 [archaeon]|jgi:hypothetical protein|nr:hypothetical protein [archaeon]MBT4241447.1 hypothetical protein [archaeon]MBT4417682.1 hypothetical protein [archaeon]
MDRKNTLITLTLTTALALGLGGIKAGKYLSQPAKPDTSRQVKITDEVVRDYHWLQARALELEKLDNQIVLLRTEVNKHSYQGYYRDLDTVNLEKTKRGELRGLITTRDQKADLYNEKIENLEEEWTFKEIPKEFIPFLNPYESLRKRK